MIALGRTPFGRVGLPFLPLPPGAGRVRAPDSQRVRRRLRDRQMPM
jgi:hypothetical protein